MRSYEKSGSIHKKLTQGPQQQLPTYKKIEQEKKELAIKEQI